MLLARFNLFILELFCKKKTTTTPVYMIEYYVIQNYHSSYMLYIVIVPTVEFSTSLDKHVTDIPVVMVVLIKPANGV